MEASGAEEVSEELVGAGGRRFMNEAFTTVGMGRKQIDVLLYRPGEATGRVGAGAAHLSGVGADALGVN